MSDKNTGARSTRTVTVASKLPNGLILRLHKMHLVQEPVMGGGMRDVQRSAEIGERYVLNGTAREPGKMPFGKNAIGVTDQSLTAVLEHGFALTTGIPADFWEEWCRQNHDLPALRNGLIFAHAQPASVRAQAKSHEGVLSGLEPIDPDAPGKLLKGIEKGEKAA